MLTKRTTFSSRLSSGQFDCLCCSLSQVDLTSLNPPWCKKSHHPHKKGFTSAILLSTAAIFIAFVDNYGREVVIFVTFVIFAPPPKSF